MFICFITQKGAFGHYMELIVKDGCHLKGHYEGILLTTMTLDANIEVLPLAVAVVNIEKEET